MTTVAELFAWAQARTSYDWSAMPSGRPVSAARPAAVAVLRDLLRDSGEDDRLRLADLDDTDLLRRLQLLRDDGTLTNAGALLTCAGSDPRIVYLGRHAASAAAAHRVELSGRGLAEELQRTLDTLDAQTTTFRLAFSQAVLGVVGAVPAPAAREALVNAIMHRDWNRPEPIVVEQTTDRLVISSPGGLYGGVTLDTLLTSRSQTRNRVLGDALRSLRLAEREGTGVDRMYIEQIRLGHPPPAFEERDGGVRVALVGGEPNASVLAVHNALPPTMRDDARAAIAIDLLRSAASITRDDLARRVREGDDELEAFLLRATAEGLLTKTAEPRPGGMPAWRLADRVRTALGSVLPYYSRPIEESVLLVAQLAVQQGSVRNRDVQDLLGVNQPRASQILRRAVQDGELRLADGAKATGRGTAYVPAASHPTP
ncbi:MAG TPA: ATP-binding protein [Conexibacter sp.]|nr:ATP-binding protein [Conexibacter sp.]